MAMLEVPRPATRTLELHAAEIRLNVMRMIVGKGHSGGAAPLEMMAIPDLFAGVGSREELLQLHRLDTESIFHRIISRL